MTLDEIKQLNNTDLICIKISQFINNQISNYLGCNASVIKYNAIPDKYIEKKEINSEYIIG